MEKKELIKLKSDQINKEYSKQRSVYSIGFCKEPKPHYEIRFFDKTGKKLTKVGVAIWPYKDKEGIIKVHNQVIVPKEDGLIQFSNWTDCGDYFRGNAEYAGITFNARESAKRFKLSYFNEFTQENIHVGTINKRKISRGSYEVTHNQEGYLNRKVKETVKEYYTLKQEQWGKIKNVVGLIDELLLI